jgi:NTE family protein
MEEIPLYKGKTKNILVISGGGLKGFSALGAVKCLMDNQIIFFPEILCGTSVGSIICFLINIGWGPNDMYNILEQLDFTSMINYVEPDKILFDPCFGIIYPNLIINVIKSFIKKKNISTKITFKQLFELTNSKLIITGTCINDSTITYFSVDNYPDMPIIKALQISISIPFIFKPYKFENKIWVDGGCMNNYPIDLFMDRLDDVIGIYLDHDYSIIKEIPDIQNYFLTIIKCVFRGLNYNKLEIFKKNTIRIINKNDNSIN